MLVLAPRTIQGMLSLGINPAESSGVIEVQVNVPDVPQYCADNVAAITR